jgi:hypothetical protein
MDCLAGYGSGSDGEEPAPRAGAPLCGPPRAMPPRISAACNAAPRAGRDAPGEAAQPAPEPAARLPNPFAPTARCRVLPGPRPHTVSGLLSQRGALAGSAPGAKRGPAPAARGAAGKVPRGAGRPSPSAPPPGGHLFPPPQLQGRCAAAAVCRCGRCAAVPLCARAERGPSARRANVVTEDLDKLFAKRRRAQQERAEEPG